MDWFRHYDGACFDPKFRTAARRAEATIDRVVFVFWALCEYASAQEERGSIEGFDPDITADHLGCEGSSIHACIRELRHLGFITSGDRVNIVTDPDRLSGELWAALRAEVFARDDYTCAYCGARGGKLECDHVHPVALGGSHEPGNLVTACFTCNRKKRAKPIEQWLKECG